MEILLGTAALEPRSYLVTVSEQLERLGHDVRAFSVEPLAPPPELRVVGVERDLPLAPDVIYSQDAEAALLLADLYPLTPQVFVAHGDRRESWLPPQLAGVVARVVVLDDRTADRVRAAGAPHELVRLRRPVDLERIVPGQALPERPRRARVELDDLSDYRRGLVQRALADARIDVDAEEADVAIGRGNTVIEALAAALPTYVYGDDGGDGWVTPERYAALEADGFSGRGEPGATTFDDLRADLAAYDPALGPAGRELAGAHDARVHAQELVATFRTVAPRSGTVSAPLRELARLVRVEAATSRRAEALAAQRNAARRRAGALELELARARESTEALEARVAALERELAEARAAARQPRGVRSRLNRHANPSSEG